MESMIDRVAKVISMKLYGGYPVGVTSDRVINARWEQTRGLAREVIEAMRDPTEGMEEAADDPVHQELKDQGQFSIEKYGKLAFASYPFSTKVWKAMINAALKEHEEGK